MDFTALIENMIEHFQPVVLLACLAAGYIVKKWIEDVDNKYIPTINLFLGAILNMLICGFTLENAIYGAIGGLASTGLHQVFKQFVEGKEEEVQ